MYQDIRNKLNIIALSSVIELTYDKDSNTLLLPVNYNIQDFISIISHYSFPNLRILSTSLITKEVIEAIRDNTHISSITLGSKEEPYVLTREVFDILNESESLFTINTDEVVGKYTSQEMEYISFFRNIHVGQYQISDLLHFTTFHFYSSLSEKEIEYLENYMASNVSIFFEYGDFQNIIKIIEKLRNRGIVFNLRELPTEMFFKEFQDLLNLNEKIYVVDSMSLDKYIFLNSYLDLMVRDIKEANMSPYEKYLGVYEIVTHFKGYLDSEQKPDEARVLDKILFNNYIVCRGFAELFVALLDKVGIKAFDIDVEFYKEKEVINIFDYAKLTKEQIKAKEGNIAYHSRVLVRLVDSKYNIDGLFIADPTWDNDLISHYFNYSSLTPYEMSLENEKFYETDISILNVSSSKEFMEKIRKLPNAVNYFLKFIEKLDFHYFKYLKNTYELDVTNVDMILDIYNYIIMHTKKRVPEEVRNQALEVLFYFIHSDLNQDYFSQIKDDNLKRDSSLFHGGRR